MPVATRKKTKLKQLVITELSLVDNPANRAARFTIYKRAEVPDDVERPVFRPTPEGQEMVRKALDAMNEQLDAQRERIDAVSASWAEIRGHRKSERNVKMMETTFMSHVARIQKRDGISKMEAMRRAAEEEPEALAEYRAEPIANNARTQAIEKGRRINANIDRGVREIMARDRVNKMQALSTLHDEEPSIFEDDE